MIGAFGVLAPWPTIKLRMGAHGRPPNGDFSVIQVSSGPLLVSRTGAAGCTECLVKGPEALLNAYHKECSRI